MLHPQPWVYTRSVRHDDARSIIGWREWLALPELGIVAIKAKIDTGARSSSLYAFGLETYRRRGKIFVRFEVHPYQRNTRVTVSAHAEVREYRSVRSSSGQASKRPVIMTDIELLGQRWPIEITLADRNEMGFRMLLGRQAVRQRFLVDPGRSYYAGKPPKDIRRPQRE
jgi:hypothetical protein